MKARILKPSHDGKVMQNRKENAFRCQYSVIDSNLNEIVVCRTYFTASRCYCVVWVRQYKKTNNKEYPFSCVGSASGGGFAGGYGYHKESAAIETALKDAGILLSEDIAGRGERAQEEALLAVAKAASKCRKFKIVTANP